MVVSENKRIAKNSCMLYIRMLFTMWLNLYATRIVLKELGSDDYGVYGVVGSVVAMFTIFNSGIVKAIQRFITFELGKENGNPNNIFCTLLNITFIFAIFTFIILEVIGLWFINTQMNIPESSKNAALWVYQFSILTTILTLISNPYNALIIAYEKINVFAYISIIQVILNFLAAFCLQFISSNHLFWYGLFIMLAAVSIRLLYQYYCHTHFIESKYHWYIDYNQVWNIAKFSGWATLDGGLNTIVWQGIIWIFNICFGPTINAVYAISGQINNAILSFAQNVQKAIDPQITKTYASGNYTRHCELIYSGSKIQVFLLYLIIIPFIIRTEYILQLWLGQVPAYQVTFCRLAVLMGLAVTFVEVARTSITATGKIRNFVLIPNITHLLLLPICYIINHIWNSPIIMMSTIVITYYIIYALRLYIASKVSIFSLRVFFYNVICRCTIIGVLSFSCIYLINKSIPQTFIGLITLLCISTLIIISFCFIIGISNNERAKLHKAISALIKHKSFNNKAFTK